MQRGRVLLGLANQTFINVLPATPTSPSHQHATRQNGNASHSGRRQLTSRPDKQKDREDYDDSDVPPPAWKSFLRLLSNAIPSTSGGKRIRTRTRRFLILLGIIALLSYAFSNTLREAYTTAAVERRIHYLEELERERLGKHLSEYERHPIKDLLDNAKKEWEEKVARQSKTADEAIAEYKRRYKRDPPNGYAEWFEYAKGSRLSSSARLVHRLINCSSDCHRERHSLGGRVRLSDGFFGAFLGT